MASNTETNTETKAENRTEHREKLFKIKTEVQRDFYRIQLEHKIYQLEKQVKIQTENLNSYRKSLPQKDEEIKRLTAEKQGLHEEFELVLECLNNHVCPVRVINKPSIRKSESQKLRNLLLQLDKNKRLHETEMFRIDKELKDEKAKCKKQKEVYEKQLAAVRSAAAQEKAKLQQSHEQELERVRSDTRAAQREIERVTRACDETANNLKKEIEDVEKKHKKQVFELKTELKDSEPEISRLCVKVKKLNTIIGKNDDVIESLQNKLQQKEYLIKRQTYWFLELKEKTGLLEQAAEREQKSRHLLEREVQENKERKATIEKLKAELETVTAENDQLKEKNKNPLILSELNNQINSLNKTLKHQCWKYRELAEKLNRTKLEAQRYKQELFNCEEAFEKAFPHASHNRDPAVRDLQTKFLTIKKKYFQGATCTSLTQSEKEAYQKFIEVLQEKLKESEERIGELLKEVEKQKTKNNADYREHAESLTQAQTRISEWGNSLVKAERDLKQEIGRLKGQITQLELELNRERERRRQAETPRTSAPQPETAVPKTGPGTVKRYQPSRVLPPVRRPPSSAQTETAVPKTGPGTVKCYQPSRVLPPIRRPPS